MNNMNNTVVGTSLYMSPERLQGNRYDPGADMWSAGLVMLECVTGKRAFESMSLVELVMTIEDWDGKDIDQLVETDTRNLMKPGMKQMISMCLFKDMKKRIPSAQLICSPYLKECGVETVDKSVAVLQGFFEEVYGIKDEEEVSAAMVKSMCESNTLPERYEYLAKGLKERGGLGEEESKDMDTDDEQETRDMEQSLKAMSMDDSSWHK
jgi:serine/threonine protein kinase